MRNLHHGKRGQLGGKSSDSIKYIQKTTRVDKCLNTLEEREGRSEITMAIGIDGIFKNMMSWKWLGTKAL